MEKNGISLFLSLDVSGTAMGEPRDRSVLVHPDSLYCGDTQSVPRDHAAEQDQASRSLLSCAVARAECSLPPQ
jgi:hypothetical protein